MSVYSNQQIRQAIASDHIVCHPFNEQHIGIDSLDVTLGHYYFRVEPANDRSMYNPFDREDVERYFDGPYKAMPHGEWCRLNGFKPVVGIPENHPVIAIKPGERILAHTHEFIGILPPGACEVKGRSSWARNGIEVNSGAGWVHPGNTNRLTLAISNANGRETVLLPVGERIAQVVFHEVGHNPDTDNESNVERVSSTLETAIKTWSPGVMLPHTYLGQRTIPPQIEGMSYE